MRAEQPPGHLLTYRGGVDPAELRLQVSRARVGYLSTVDATGRPHAVPVCFALVGDRVYSAVDHKPKRTTRLRRLADIEATGVGCLLVSEYDEDWSQLWWARVEGSCRLVDDETERAAALDSLVAKYLQYADRPPIGPVLALDVDRWVGWSAG
jgi:PPOX class probable F420-dependent enzyme